MTTVELFRTGMQRLAVAFGVEFGDDRMDVYWSVMSRYSAEQIRRALQLSLENDFRFPALADLRKYIEELHGKRPDGPKTRVVAG